jgi:hypothetical protein
VTGICDFISLHNILSIVYSLLSHTGAINADIVVVPFTGVFQHIFYSKNIEKLFSRTLIC